MFPIRQEVLGQGVRYVLIGLAVGLGGALAGTRLIVNLLFEVKQTDLATYLFVSLLLLLLALLSIYLPALRATKVDPLTALRLRIAREITGWVCSYHSWRKMTIGSTFAALRAGM